MRYPSRRLFLQAGAATAASAALPAVSFARTGGEERLVVILLRGALDGLAAVPPYGDANYRSVRGELEIPIGGDKGAQNLDGFFALHPALADLMPFWNQNQLAILHATATPYRARSHFSAQRQLETGGETVHGFGDGWLNRAVQGLHNPSEAAMAIGESMPLILTGDMGVASWAPSSLPDPDPGYFDRIEMLLADDPLLGPALAKGLKTHDLGRAARMAGQSRGSPFTKMGKSIATLLKAPNGPRIASFEISGWDTHFVQGTNEGVLHNRLRRLPQLLVTLQNGLEDVWERTAVVMVTEFGRTARPNGTRGTDHGTGAAAFVLGGAVRGGRVISDWPGLGQNQLYENRDLLPTIDIRTVFAGLLLDHMKLSENHLFDHVFPGGHRLTPMQGLVRT